MGNVETFRKSTETNQVRNRRRHSKYDPFDWITYNRIAIAIAELRGTPRGRPPQSARSAPKQLCAIMKPPPKRSSRWGRAG